ncbi:MAG TPA: methyltransferase domain-containing protein [Candidatus Fimimonas merdipullorum]|uniref:Methyltransferase n=1 Tax=Candidatus Fimimonas merdipullorum TaxID=2840822 RepID=A0A9D1MVW9_9BACT|nr:methyltransferase domain-containing protein [Candidatus Fimimonas merdipullorum]
MAKKNIPLQPENFELETNTVWAFPDRGKWATHDAKYRGNWSPYIPRNVILRYSHEGEIVLDPFVGGGTTAVEAKLTQRNFIGYDINPAATELSRKKCNFQFTTEAFSAIDVADARNLPLADSSVDLICTHPPYADIIHYSEDIAGDLSLLPMKEFLHEMGKVAKEFYRVLKKDKFCAVLMGDTRKKGMVQPLAFETMRLFELAGFKTKEIIIKEQHNCKATGYWKTNSIKYNFLLLAHEHLFVFKK